MISSHTLVAGVYTPQTYDLNPRQQLPLQLDQQGNLRVAGYVRLTDGTNVNAIYDTGAQKVTDTANGPVAPGVAATHSQLAGGVYNSSDVSLTTGQQTALQLDARGFLKTTLADSALRPYTIEATESFFKRTYQITTNIFLPSTSMHSLILLSNPVGSGKTLYLRNITLANTTGAAKTVTLSVNSNPTVSVVGTPLTPTSLNIGGGANASVCVVTYNNIATGGGHAETMTVTNTGTVLSSIVATNETNTMDYNYGLIFNANNSILLTAVASAIHQTVSINITWSEV